MSFPFVSMNPIFSQLVATYPTYDALLAHVTTLGIQVNTKEGDPLVVMRYNREKSPDMNNPVVRAFRSVVWDSSTNKPLFAAPMKSEQLATLPAVFAPSFIVEELIDGVMVNLFFDPYKQIWRLVTRSRLDADNKFFNHTFCDLFMQAWTAYAGTSSFDMLNKGFGYSFVLRHPANRIVVPVSAPSLNCVEVSSVDPVTLTYGTMASAHTLAPPRRFNAGSAADCLTVLLPHIQQFEGLLCQGAVVRDMSTGRRWKMRTDLYATVRKMRGNHSKMEYVWFENFKNGTLEAYLAYYPEERAGATAALAQWTKVVSETYNLYVHVFKVRDCAKSAIPAQYKGILFDLHGQYLSRLAPAKQSLTWQEHQSIMGRQDLKRMVFLATYKNTA